MTDLVKHKENLGVLRTMAHKVEKLKQENEKLRDVSAKDTEALEYAEMTLKAIRDTDPGVYDEIIDPTLRMITAALKQDVVESEI